MTGKLPLVSFRAMVGSVTTGVCGMDTGISSGIMASPPRASNNSACLVRLLPNFIPEPLNDGGRMEDGTGFDVVRGDVISGASKRGTAE